MATVKNWQLDREMEYPYEGNRPKRQITMFFDLNKCIACQTCTMACKTTWTSGKGQEAVFWNNVESKPYGFYPLAWDVKVLDLLGSQPWSGSVYKGKTIFEDVSFDEKVRGYLPDEMDYTSPNLGEDEASQIQTTEGDYIKGPVHKSWGFYLPRICNHCTYPGCLAACPRKAIYKRQDDGIVLIDQSKCRGYRECVKACPYKKAFYNNTTRVSEKCISCYPKIEAGEMSQCVTNCIGRIRIQAFKTTDLTKIRKNNVADFLIHVRKIALPLYPQFGTEPNNYYIPPIHVDPAYLTQMFGPGVENAIKQYRNAGKDKELLAALILFGNTEKISDTFKYDAKTDEAVSYDEKGKEIVRVPCTEPIYIRKVLNAKSGAFLTNNT
ncbi:MAG: dehydrogenase [Gallionella sp.]|nr:dehydrogenase [Gallionella sp.]